MTTRRLVGLVVGIVVLLPPASASAATELTFGSPSPDAPAPAEVEVPDTPVDLGVVPLPLRIEAGEGVVIELADGRTFLDVLEIRTGPDGAQVLVNDLTIDDYVAGVAEMPGRWHLEALKAQAVAARTYAWHQAELGTFQRRGVGYEICDTVDCQVFRGAAQEEGWSGRRWRQAVTETAGEVLLDDDGGPILARYFSTSGGRTMPNEVVFPSSGPRPYLVGTDDPADAVSPLHRWQVRFTREEFETILGRGERLSTVVPLASVERQGEVHDPNVDVLFTGQDGTQVAVAATDLRRFVSDVAPNAFPDRFPTARADGVRPLPTTLPSARFEVQVGDDEVVVDGQGWGHAVGLGQYGALGRAEAGETYDDILAAYYNGLRPTASDQAPERVRVGLSQPSVGSWRADGPVTVRADGEVVAEGAVGTWQVERDGAGIRLTAPPGWGTDPVVSATTPTEGAEDRTDAARVEAATSVPGTAALVVTDEAGDEVVTRNLGPVEAGVVTAAWDLADREGSAAPSGEYQLEIRITPTDDQPRGSALAVRIDRPSAFEAVTGADGERWPVIAVALATLAVGVVLLARAGRRPAGRSAGPDDDRGAPRGR